MSKEIMPKHFDIKCHDCGSDDGVVYVATLIDSCDTSENHVEVSVVCTNCSFTEDIHSEGR